MHFFIKNKLENICKLKTQKPTHLREFLAVSGG